MRIGVTLPSFRGDTYALDAARRAEELGIDGVFVFDHLWPLRQPERPALSALPLLGAVAASTERVQVGPLVARVGLLPEQVLRAALLSLARIAPGRLIAALGTGDSKSADENRAYGIPFAPAEQRRRQLAHCARSLRDRGIPVWVGGGSAATTELAAEVGAAVNVWVGQPATVASLASRVEVTWAGPVEGELPRLVTWLTELAGAGASWAVCAWPSSIEAVAEAAASVR